MNLTLWRTDSAIQNTLLLKHRFATWSWRTVELLPAVRAMLFFFLKHNVSLPLSNTIQYVPTTADISTVEVNHLVIIKHFLKGWITRKFKFCHYLLKLILFQTWKTFTRGGGGNILNNVGYQFWFQLTSIVRKKKKKDFSKYIIFHRIKSNRFWMAWVNDRILICVLCLWNLNKKPA